MDMNLHSFILVMGLLVIGFIVFDGIKKIRESKKNQLLDFDDQLDDSLQDSTLLHDQEELHQHGIDELEIADDLVDGAFSHDLIPDIETDIHGNITVKSSAEESSEQAASPSESEEINQSVESFSALDDEPNYQKDNPESSNEPIEVLSKDDLVPYADDVEVSVGEIEKDANPVSDPLPEDVATQPIQSESEQHFKFELKEEADSSPSESVEASEVVKPELELDPEEAVPVLMEPVELGEEVDPNPPVQHELHLPEFVQQTLQDEPKFETIKKDTPAEAELQDYIDMNLDEADVALQEQPVKAQVEQVGELLAEREPAQEVFVIHVLNEQGLNGADLRRVFTACDMRFGEMEIYHRFEKANAQGKIQFSVANALEPGSFDLNTMDELSTPGISLFMSLPGPENAMEAFDAMAEVALVFARNFNANLCDDSHSDLNPQTLEHYRQRIRDFSRKQFSTKR